MVMQKNKSISAGSGIGSGVSNRRKSHQKDGAVRVVGKNVRRNKYGAVKVTVDGVRFDSKLEARRYGVLKLLEKHGQIVDLKRQVKFRLDVNGYHIAYYIADFTYHNQNGELIVEDAKGVETPVFKFKAKLMLAVHNVKVHLTRDLVRK